jgi:hypothetical protein
MPSPDTDRSPARLQRSLAALAILVTIGIAFAAVIVSLGGTRALVTALLAGVGTVAFTLVATALFMRRRSEASAEDSS